MNKNGRSLRRRYIVDYALAAMSQMELYCEAHPGSPSAVRRPRLFVRGELWIALLGPRVEEGIVGIGPTVSGPSRVRRAIFGRIASARRGDSRLSTKAERVLRARAFPSGEMKRESPQQVYHNRCYILTRTKCELERTYEKGASLMRAGRLRRRDA
jgi:hypothetical protein